MGVPTPQCLKTQPSTPPRASAPTATQETPSQATAYCAYTGHLGWGFLGIVHHGAWVWGSSFNQLPGWHSPIEALIPIEALVR